MPHYLIYRFFFIHWSRKQSTMGFNTAAHSVKAFHALAETWKLLPSLYLNSINIVLCVRNKYTYILAHVITQTDILLIHLIIANNVNKLKKGYTDYELLFIYKDTLLRWTDLWHNKNTYCGNQTSEPLALAETCTALDSKPFGVSSFSSFHATKVEVTLTTDSCINPHCKNIQ